MMESRASGGVVIIDRYHSDIRRVVKALGRAHALLAVAYKIYKIRIVFLLLYASEGSHNGLQSKGKNHQKLKTDVSVARQKLIISLNFLNKSYHIWSWNTFWFWNFWNPMKIR